MRVQRSYLILKTSLKEKCNTESDHHLLFIQIWSNLLKRNSMMKIKCTLKHMVNHSDRKNFKKRSQMIQRAGCVHLSYTKGQ